MGHIRVSIYTFLRFFIVIFPNYIFPLVVRRTILLKNYCRWQLLGLLEVFLVCVCNFLSVFHALFRRFTVI